MIFTAIATAESGLVLKMRGQGEESLWKWMVAGLGFPGLLPNVAGLVQLALFYTLVLLFF